MSLRLALLLVPAAFLSGPAASTPIALGEQKFFRDWAVACDNSLSCKAVALVPEGEPIEERLALAISRNSVDGNIAVTLIADAAKNDRYRLIIGRRIVDSGNMATAGDGTVELTGDKALKVARAIARGLQLRLEDGNGTMLGKASLVGSTAALRHIDKVQNRAGTPQAIVSIGKKRSRPLSASVPKIAAQRIGAEGPIPEAGTIIKIVESSGCAANRFETSEDSAYSLGRINGVAKALILVSCGSGAYNRASLAYIANQGANGSWAYEPARFDLEPPSAGEKGRPFLSNVGWSRESQMLSGFAKARGLGDCGSSENFTWDGATFRLVEANGMAQCRGSLDWMRLWRADVTFTD
jgi:hypothetical protein